ncbi:NEQ097 [Nanoarchaeum equitans Kin4-M]|uniref:NEQ097 n=1 Tax=Nanoarchaeum equitans (strain Kin4-M) TaxID=228908 RepID=Q74MK2_NANEQ|nr:NEQ097 [Nanoarchaeum equitans Kin4-M]
MQRIIPFLFLILVLVFLSLIPKSCKVEYVIDGDTIKTSCGKVRLSLIDAHERGEPLYEKAKEFVQQFLRNCDPVIIKEGYDKYNRILALVKCNNKTLNVELVKNKLAIVYLRYCPYSKFRDYDIFYNFCHYIKSNKYGCLELKRKGQKVIIFNKCDKIHIDGFVTTYNGEFIPINVTIEKQYTIDFYAYFHKNVLDPKEKIFVFDRNGFLLAQLGSS